MQLRILLAFYLSWLIPMVAAAQAGDTIYLADPAGTLLQFTVGAPTPVPVGATGNEIRVLAIDSARSLVGVVGNRGLVSIDRQSGAATSLPLALPPANTIIDLTFDDQRQLRLLVRNVAGIQGQPTDALWRVDRTTGVATSEAVLDGLVSTLAWHDGVFFGFDLAAEGSVVQIDPNSGALVPIASLGGVSALGTGSDFDRAGRLVAFTAVGGRGAPARLMAFDLGTGLGELLFEGSPLIGVAILPTRGAQDIPALGAVGGICLILLLLVVAITTLRRVARRHEPRCKVAGA